MVSTCSDVMRFLNGPVLFLSPPAQNLGVAKDESRKLQESLRLMGDEVTTAERAQSKAMADCASAQRLLRCRGRCCCLL